jgi:hypothetical protein
MMHRGIGRSLALLALPLMLLSCGGGGGSTNPVAPPTTGSQPPAASTATPVPTPTPPPCTQGLCEAPTTNTAPPTRIFVKVFQVLKPNGDPAPCSGEDPSAPGGPAPFTIYGFAPIPVGYRVVIDATAFDSNNKATNSDCATNASCINWRQDAGSELIDNFTAGSNIFQPKFYVTGAGDYQLQAEMLNNGNRVRSPWFWLKFVDSPSQSPCGR